MRHLSSFKWESVLKQNQLWTRNSSPELYCLFVFDPVHNLHFGALKLLKGFMVLHLSSKTSIARYRLWVNVGRALSQVRKAALFEINSYFEQQKITEEFFDLGSTFRRDMSSEANDLFMNGRCPDCWKEELQCSRHDVSN